MACACKVNQQIAYLQKKYGHDIPKSKTSDIRGMVSMVMKEIGLFIVIMPFLPVMAVVLLFQIMFSKKKPLRIDKIFKIKRKHG